MVIKFELFLETPEETAAREAKPHWTQEHPVAREQVRCLCGRFAKWAGGRHYYNGQFACYSYDVLCSRCGTVTVECV